jgi:hypothetical protein
MLRCLAVVGILALITQGCTKKPESYPITAFRDKPSYPMTAFRVDYQTWSCQQLADEADLLHDAYAVASETRSDENVAHLKAETEAVHKTRIAKNCIRS